MSSHSRPPPVTIHPKRTIAADLADISSKRRKLEHPIDAPKDFQCPPTTHISVKREPSPSPPPSLALRTSGTIRIDIPHDCRKTQVGWKEQRGKWVVQETLKLNGLGLKVPKAIVRDDGLALDWVSLVPVCPLTLRPPRPVTPSDSGTQDVQPLQVSDSKPPVDPLGHALRDQTVSAYLSSTVVAKSSQDALNDNEHQQLPPTQAINSGALSDFVVVGAATHKAAEGPGSEAVAEHLSDRTVQREHRKLLPLGLRPSTKGPWNKEGAKNRRVRRLAWITKEIEKVEAYTGEKVAGFRYDGDDVIIQLVDRSSRVHRKRKQASYLASQRAQLDYAQPTVSRTPNLRPNASPIASSSWIGSGESHTKDPTRPPSQGSVNTALDTTGRRPIKVAMDAPGPDPRSHSIKNTASSNEATMPTLGLSEQSTSLSDFTIKACQSVFRARGLGFLERYVQVFDSERDALSLAYTPNATFSLTEDRFEYSSDDCPKIHKTGRSEIVDTLNKIISDLRYPPLAEIACNIVSLDDMSPGGLLLTCKGALLTVDRPRHQREHQSFFSRVCVLRPNHEDNRYVASTDCCGTADYNEYAKMNARV